MSRSVMNHSDIDEWVLAYLRSLPRNRQPRMPEIRDAVGLAGTFDVMNSMDRLWAAALIDKRGLPVRWPAVAYQLSKRDSV